MTTQEAKGNDAMSVTELYELLDDGALIRANLRAWKEITDADGEPDQVKRTDARRKIVVSGLTYGTTAKTATEIDLLFNFLREVRRINVAYATAGFREKHGIEIEGLNP